MLIAKWVRRTANVLAVIIGIAIALVLIVVAINIPDEELSPETQAALTPPPNPYRDQDNIYIALLGLAAPSGASVIETGLRKVDSYNRLQARYPLDPTAVNEEFESSNSQSSNLHFRGEAQYLNPLHSSTWTTVITRAQDVDVLLADNRELYYRYMDLHNLHGYYETVKPSIMPLFAYVPTELRSLFLATAAKDIQSAAPKNRTRALHALFRDIECWENVFKGEGTLVSKMVATVSLQGDLLVIADMIADPQIRLSTLGSDFQRNIAAFEAPDWRIGKTFFAEFRISSTILTATPFAIVPITDIDGQPTSWSERQWNAFIGLFYKPNATLNLQTPDVLRRLTLGDSEPGKLLEAQNSYQVWIDRNISFDSLLTWRTAYNPAGKYVAAYSTFDDYVTRYALRIYDVTALQRLVYLAYQLRLQSIAPKDVSAFMHDHPEWSTHPVDGKFFAWDQATCRLAVNTLGKQPEGRRFDVTLPCH